MSARIKVTGYLEVPDDEADRDHSTGLTEEAYLRYTDELGALDDLDFELADDD